ncbi:hypothetical protein VTP01DRAFT_7147 [Rhizomucor pusillus]|uniref:uncharacterized protein n=1 Tax=Rhizomucor pusillus TaxID=4840 RepID=UPI0037439443
MGELELKANNLDLIFQSNVSFAQKYRIFRCCRVQRNQKTGRSDESISTDRRLKLVLGYCEKQFQTVGLVMIFYLFVLESEGVYVMFKIGNHRGAVKT